MIESNPDRRKTRIVDAPRQRRMVLGITAVPMGVLLLAAVVMWVFTNRLFDEAQASNAELPSLGLLTMTQYLFVVVTGVLAVWEAWRYSHRVVGPAARIAGALRRLREGKPDNPIVLRRSDELQMIADELNPLIEEMQRRGAGTPAAAPPAATPPESAAAVTRHGD